MAPPHSAASTSTDLLKTVVLKKYGNRRLYDTHASRYVTLEEVEGMVQRGTDIQVVDAKTHDDLTKEILVQIILDKEQAKEMLPTGFLKQVVRLSSTPMKESFTRALQDSLDGFLSAQRTLVDTQRAVLSQMQQQGFSPWNPFSAFTPPPPAAVPTAPPVTAAQKDAEMDVLRQQMGETQALLRQLLEKERHPGVKKKARPSRR